MSKNNYVDMMKQMMESQNNHFLWFLGILTFVIAVAGYLQWKVSDKQLDVLKKNLNDDFEKKLTMKIEYLENDYNSKIEAIKKQYKTLTEYTIEKDKQSLHYDLRSLYISDYISEIISLLKKYNLSTESIQLFQQDFLYNILGNVDNILSDKLQNDKNINDKKDKLEKLIVELEKLREKVNDEFFINSSIQTINKYIKRHP